MRCDQELCSRYSDTVTFSTCNIKSIPGSSLSFPASKNSKGLCRTRKMTASKPPQDDGFQPMVAGADTSQPRDIVNLSSNLFFAL